MLWLHWLYIFDTVAPLVYFFTPFIHSILIVKMYKRHIFTLLNEVSPVQIYKSESTNKSRPLYLFFTYLQVQYSYSPLTFILNMMISIILSLLVYTSKRCWLCECVVRKSLVMFLMIMPAFISWLTITFGQPSRQPSKKG